MIQSMVQLVKREGNKWVSVYGIDGVLSVPAHTSACPLNYCKDIEIVSLIRPGELCNGGRIGILSGHCPSGQSVVFGSPECQLCSNMWRMTILMYAVFEAFFTGCCVFMLNMTVMQGTLYRLIFYANIIQVNATVFFNPSILSPLEIIISFINLDLLCFYDGMDDATKQVSSLYFQSTFSFSPSQSSWCVIIVLITLPPRTDSVLTK